MPRSQGQVLERRWKQGRGYALRFRAYGERQYVTLGMQSEGWTGKRAQIELQNVLADVRRGTWIPPDRNKRTRAKDDDGSNEPTFHEFASAWHAERQGEITPSGHRSEEWALSYHLLPYFANWRLSEIDIAAVDDYRRYKVKQGEQRAVAIAAGKPVRGENGCVQKPLAAASINKTINVLHAILELAVEYGHVSASPAVGRRRRLKLPAQRPVHLDAAEQIQALLDAAGELDHDTRRPTCDRRAIIATLILAGPRAHELCNLRWRDVDLANGRIHIGRSKTQSRPAGDPAASSPARRTRHPQGQELPSRPRRSRLPHEHRRAARQGQPPQPDPRPALVRADALLLQRGQTPLPAGVTPHKLRHTFSSILVALGWDPASAMAALGHADPRMKLRVYTYLMRRGSDERRRLAELVDGDRSEARPPGERTPA